MTEIDGNLDRASNIVNAHEHDFEPEKEFDTRCVDEPTCPYCGYEEQNAWEINFGDGCEGDTTITCGNCDNEYFLFKNNHN